MTVTDVTDVIDVAKDIEVEEVPTEPHVELEKKELERKESKKKTQAPYAPPVLRRKFIDYLKERSNNTEDLLNEIMDLRVNIRL